MFVWGVDPFFLLLSFFKLVTNPVSHSTSQQQSSPNQSTSPFCLRSLSNFRVLSNIYPIRSISQRGLSRQWKFFVQKSSTTGTTNQIRPTPSRRQFPKPEKITCQIFSRHCRQICRQNPHL